MPSPATGFIVSKPSRIRQNWLGIAKPYGIDRHSGSTSVTWYQIDQMDASVAPPSDWRNEFGARALRRSFMVSGIQSPDSAASRSLAA